MVRIGGSTDRGKHIKENDYYTPSGEFRVDQEGSSTLLNCLMYKMSYYKFGSVYTEGGTYNELQALNDLSLTIILTS
jgi:dolichyl-diphosphooligosaccharide--protein glycosyltransferase